MRAPERRQDEAALERLRDHEAALSHRLETARAEAEDLRRAAEEQAAAIRKDGRERLEQEVAAEVELAAIALTDEVRARREESVRLVASVARESTGAREGAVARAVEVASGGGP